MTPPEPLLESVEGPPISVPEAGPTPLERLLDRGRLRALLTMLGPAFVAAVAYVDPGNFATNIQGGAKYGYQLMWVVLVANLIAMLVQYLSAKLGIVSGRSLPEVCREHLPRWSTWGLWIQAEIMAMATDVAEFLGAAIGLNLLFGVPLLVAGLITGVIAFAILELQRRGHRGFELAIAGLLGIVFLGFLYETLKIGPSAPDALRGLIPHLGGGSAAYLAVGIVGATVMPHVIYLHSALTKARVEMRNDTERRRVLRYQRVDVIVALSLAGLINLAMLAVAAKLLHGVGGPVRGGHDPGSSRPVQPPRRRRGGAGLRRRPARLRIVIVERRHVRRPGGDVRLHRGPDPAARAAHGDDAAGADHPRARREHHRRARAQSGRAVLRDPVRAHPARAADQSRARSWAISPTAVGSSSRHSRSPGRSRR